MSLLLFFKTNSYANDNKAKDETKETKFDKLHKVSVL